MLKMTVKMVVSLLLLLSFLFADEKKEFIFATGYENSSWFSASDSLAKLLTEKLKPEYGYTFKAVPTTGSIENIELMREKKADFATLQGLYALMASVGDGIYKNHKQTHIRTAFYLWPNVENFTLRKDLAKTGNILDVKNVYGKSFALGPDDDDFRKSGEIILSSLGIDYKKFFIPQVGYAQSADSFLKGEALGMNTPSYPPAFVVSKIFTQRAGQVELLGFKESQLKAINTKYELWKPFYVKSGTYEGQKKDIMTISQPTLFVVSDEISDKVVYLMLKTIYENLETLHKMNPELKEIYHKKIIEVPPVNFHKGSMKYYKENGVKFRFPDASVYKFFG